jgi:hypothetical protein
MSNTIVFQRLEGLAVLAGAISIYFWQGFKWYWLVIFLLVFDGFMIGYFINKKAGAYIYNIGHSFVLPIGLVVVSAIQDWRFGLGVGLIWLAHIGVDRASGYGLKEITGFQDTHLGTIGKKKAAK